jgi:hypothetical protein
MYDKALRPLERRICLRAFAEQHYGIKANEKGMAPCPFHRQKGLGLQFWVGRDGIDRFTDCHTGKSGTVIDFIMALKGCSRKEAIAYLKEASNE